MSEEDTRKETETPQTGELNAQERTRMDAPNAQEPRNGNPKDDLDAFAGISEAEQKRRDNIQSAYDSAREEAERTEAEDEPVHVMVSTVGTIIGRGHHSNVYKAELAGSKAPVALKVDYRNLLYEYPRVWEKVKALREIKDDHIQRFIDFVPDWKKNRSYMILEYVPGDTLQKLLYDRTQDGGAPFPQGRVLNWALQILDALQYLHRHRLLHGDINLSNIMLRPKKGNKGEEEHDICLIDFNWSAPDLGAGETRPDIQSDDPADDRFSKPQSRDAFRRGIRRDIYHVGMVMYYLLTGEVPDPDKGRAELLKEEKETDASEKRRNLKAHGVTDDVAEVILTAISVDPQKRYRSAKRMQDALTKLPKLDEKANRLKTVVIPSVCAVLGALLIALGVILNSQVQRMKERAVKAGDAFAQGDYTQALLLGREAVGSYRPSAFVPEEGQETLKRILGLDRSGAGYRPWASLPIEDGVPVRVRLSQDESWLVILLKRSEQDEETFRILAYSMKERQIRTLSAVSKLDDFAFADNHTILYADGNRLMRYNLNSGEQEWEPPKYPPSGEDAAGPIALAVSGNQAKIAVLYPESNQAYLYAPNGALWGTVTLDETPRELHRRMFLLDEKGDTLAVSLSGADVGVYDVSSNQRIEGVALTQTDNNYTDYEGGFYGAWLLFTASVTYNDGEMLGERHRFFLDEMRNGANDDKYHIEEDVHKPYHVRTDRNGMFTAEGNSYRHVTENAGKWGPLRNIEGMEGDIILLEHTPDDDGGRFLIGVRREVFVIDANGAELARLAADSWNLGALSPEWLALTGTNRQMLSLLRWTPERARDGATFSLKELRKEADEWWNALSEWDGRIEDK